MISVEPNIDDDYDHDHEQCISMKSHGVSKNYLRIHNHIRYPG